MTTIAWDGKTLAADKLSQNGTGLRQRVKKIFESTNWYYAGTGDFAECYLMAEWFDAHVDPDKRPSFDENVIRGVAVNKMTWSAYIVEGKKPVLIPVTGPYYACGSGAPYAMAAMYLGKSAYEAIEVASALNVDTGCGIDVVEPLSTAAKATQ